MEREVGMGDYVTLVKDTTIVDGLITGFMMDKGALEYVFIDNIKSGFKLSEWEVRVEDEVQS
jgi:hypothetical protein